MEKNNLSDAIQKGAKAVQKGAQAGKKTAKAAKSVVKTAASPVRRKWFLITTGIFFVIILIALIGGTSQSQMTSTYYLTANDEDNGWNMPEKDNEKAAIWEKKTAVEQSNKLMSVIQEIKNNDKESQKKTISSYCSSHGWDAAESLAHLQESSTIGYANTSTGTADNEDKNEITKTTSVNKDKKKNSSKKDKGNVIQEFSLDGVTSAQLSKFSYESINRSWHEGTVQKKIYDSKKWYADEYGLCKYKNDDGTEDFLVALGPYFGATGNRYRISFKNGTAATFLKFDAKAPGDTIGNMGIVGTNGGLLEFVVDEPKLHPKISFSGDVHSHPKKIFDEITKIELIEGTMSSSFSMGLDMTDSMVLSAYSVAVSNAELTKVDGLFSGWFQHVGEKYVNEKGFKISVVWFGENAGRIDYEADLEKRLKKYLRKGGSFYKLDYERENGEIKVYTKIQSTESLEGNPSSGTNDKKKSQDKVQENTIRYVIPILTEVDIMDILYDLFEIKPDDAYVNDDDSGITNKEAITNIAEETTALIYDASRSSDGNINISDLSGMFAWPAPGVNTITSLFGNRYHPVSKVWKYHDGIDIGAPYGTSIVACEDGTVIQSGSNSGYGICVQIRHEGGIVTLYGHLSETSVKTGQKVSKGQEIGISGSTGISTGPHLHLTIKANGNAVDPIGFVLTPESYKNIKIDPDA